MDPCAHFPKSSYSSFNYDKNSLWPYHHSLSSTFHSPWLLPERSITNNLKLFPSRKDRLDCLPDFQTSSQKMKFFKLKSRFKRFLYRKWRSILPSTLPIRNQTEPTKTSLHPSCWNSSVSSHEHRHQNYLQKILMLYLIGKKLIFKFKRLLSESN